MNRKAEIKHNQGVVARIAAGLRGKREAFARKTPRYTGTDDLIAEFNKAGKVKNPPLIRELAIAKAASEFLELGSDVKIRREIIDIIASKLVPKTVWQREQSNARKGLKLAPHHKEWQKQADEIWAKNPNLSKPAVAKQIARRGKGDAAQIKSAANWIRRVISKRK